MKTLLVAILLALMGAVMADLISNVADLASPIIAALPDLQRAYEMVVGTIG